MEISQPEEPAPAPAYPAPDVTAFNLGMHPYFFVILVISVWFLGGCRIWLSGYVYPTVYPSSVLSEMETSQPEQPTPAYVVPDVTDDIEMDEAQLVSEEVADHVCDWECDCEPMPEGEGPDFGPDRF